MSITYARFNDSNLARRASQAIRGRIGDAGRIEILRSPTRLSHHMIPLRMTAVRVGTILGGIVVGLLWLLVVATLFWTGTGRTIPAAGETLALSLGLSTLFGAFAGALSFASDNGAKVQLMQAWLRKGDPVVIVDAARAHEETLRCLGAQHVGKIV